MFYDICYPENLCDPRRRMIKLLFYLFILYNKSHLSIYSKHTSILLLCNSKINHKCTERIPKMGSSPFIIGVAGGTASGKSSVCARIIDRLSTNSGQKRVVAISQDSFYRNLANEEEVQKARRGDFNFDHPDAFEHTLMVKVLRELKQRKAVKIPAYDFKTQSRVGWQDVDAADVILVEGILIFFDQELRDIFDLKLFVDADPDIRLARRVERDTKERGRQLQHVLHQYLTLVKPRYRMIAIDDSGLMRAAFEDFCLPTKKYADVIIPRGAENSVAIDLIVQHIQEILRTPPPPDHHRISRLDGNEAKQQREGMTPTGRPNKMETAKEEANGVGKQLRQQQQDGIAAPIVRDVEAKK